MHFTKLTVLGLIGALVLGGSTVLAQQGPGEPVRARRRARAGGRRPGQRPGGRIMQILDEQQKAQFGQARPRRVAQLNLTDEQKTKAKQIWAGARKQAKAAATRVERLEIYKKAQSDLQSLLTDDQRAKLAELRKDRGPGIDLTEQQKAEMVEIRKASRAAMVFAETPEARRQLLDQTREDIKSVLTAEQLAKLDAFQKTQAERGKLRGGRRGGRDMMGGQGRGESGGRGMMGGLGGMGRRGRGESGGRGMMARPGGMGRGGRGGQGMMGGPGMMGGAGGMGRGGWINRQLDEPKDDLPAELK